MTIETLVAEISRKNQEHYELKRNRYRKANNWASDYGECARQMFYSINDWDKRPLHSVELMERFEKGRKEESERIQWLMNLGFEVIENQVSFEIKGRNGKVHTTGKIDGKILWQKVKYPFEVKSMNPNVFNRISSVEDLLKSDWTTKYVRQLQIYLYANNVENGLFIITDCLGHYKTLVVTIDYKLIEGLLQRGEQVMECVEKQEPPDFIKDVAKCRKCWAFKLLCHPPVDFGEGVQVLDDVELEDDLKKRDELQAANKEYEALDKKVKERLKPIPHAVCGNFESIVKEVSVKYKAQEARELIQKRVEISKIESDVTVELE